MPLYEFVCRRCGAKDSRFTSMEMAGALPPPSCCELPMARLYTTNVVANPVAWRDEWRPGRFDTLEQRRADEKAYEKSWTPEPDANVLPESGPY